MYIRLLKILDPTIGATDVSYHQQSTTSTYSQALVWIEVFQIFDIVLLFHSLFLSQKMKCNEQANSHHVTLSGHWGANIGKN